MVIVPASLAIQAMLHAEIHTIVIGVVMMILVSSLVFFRLLKLLGDERRSVVREAQRVALLVDNDELRSLDMLKDQFIATVSHELRTPLTSIRGYLELLLSETDLAEKHRKLLAIVDRNSDRLLRLVGDLLSSRKWMLAS
jgi:signal transduction histidine kinase